MFTESFIVNYNFIYIDRLETTALADRKMVWLFFLINIPMTVNLFKSDSFPPLPIQSWIPSESIKFFIT